MLCKVAPSQTKYEQATTSTRRAKKKKERGRQHSASGEHPHRQVRGRYNQYLMSAITIFAHHLSFMIGKSYFFFSKTIYFF